MRHEHVEVLGTELRGLEGAVGDLAHLEGGPAEHRRALHAQVGTLGAVAVEEGDPVEVLADRVELGAVRAPDHRAELLLFGGSDDDRAGPVAEDETVGAVGHVHGHRELLGADDQHVGGAAAADHVGGERHAVTETGATDGDVEGGHAVAAEFGRDLGGSGRGQQQVGVRGEDDGVDVRALQQRIGDRLAAGVDRHLHDALVATREPARLDSRTGVDPLV